MTIRKYGHLPFTLKSLPSSPVPEPHQLELIGIVFVQKRYGIAHFSVIITRNVRSLTHIDSVVIVILWELVW